MPITSTRCPKCGLTQMTRSRCKKCDTALNGSKPTLPSGQPLSPPSSDSPPVTPMIDSSLTSTAGDESGKSPASRRASTDPPPTGVASRRSLSFHGSGGSLLGIHLVNLFLTLLTFGIYHFWGKVKVRSYLLGQTELDGDRFAYHGTGKELLIGFLKGGILLGIVYALFNTALWWPVGIVFQVGAIVLGYLLLMVFIPVAMVGARRYRLSRTSWRGIRFSFRAPIKDFIRLFIGGSLLTFLTLGLYYPLFIARKYAFMLSHTYLGDRRFDFDGKGKDLFGTYLFALLLFPLTLGIHWFWFKARLSRYFWDHTLCGAVRFRYTATGGGLFLLGLGNLLLLIGTLGFAWSWVTIRNVQFVFRHLALEGEPAWESIRQEPHGASATGEGLDSLLDLDTGLGIG